MKINRFAQFIVLSVAMLGLLFAFPFTSVHAEGNGPEVAPTAQPSQAEPRRLSDAELIEHMKAAGVVSEAKAAEMANKALMDEDHKGVESSLMLVKLESGENWASGIFGNTYKMSSDQHISVVFQTNSGENVSCIAGNSWTDLHGPFEGYDMRDLVVTSNVSGTTTLEVPVEYLPWWEKPATRFDWLACGARGAKLIEATMAVYYAGQQIWSRNVKLYPYQNFAPMIVK